MTAKYRAKHRLAVAQASARLSRPTCVATLPSGKRCGRKPADGSAYCAKCAARLTHDVAIERVKELLG